MPFDRRRETNRKRRIPLLQGVSKTAARRLREQSLRFELLEPRCLLSADPLITEFMADNSTGLKDYYNNYSDWLEIYNPDTVPLNLGSGGGWKLRDGSSTWTFPASATVAAKGYLKVFASGRDTIAPNGELHTNFKLSSSSGEYLGLARPDGAVVSEYVPQYPPQYADVSYGLATEPVTSILVSAGASGKWFVPGSSGDLTDTNGKGWGELGFTDTAWSPGAAPLGYDVSPATGSNALGLSILETHGSTLTDMQSAVDLIDGGIGTMTTYAATVVNYADPQDAAAGHFGSDAAFGGDTAGADNSFALRVRGTIRIPSTGAWTFGVNSSDGFRLTLTGASFNTLYGCTNTIGTSVMQYDGTRTAADSLGVVNSLAAGNYDFELVYFDATGPAGVEFFASSGARSAFGSTFKLVGDTASGGLALLRVGDVAGSGNPAFATASYGYNASALVRIPFSVASPADIAGLSLRMKYDDGFVAYLNGVELARSNTPETLAWDSAATADHLTGDAVRYEDFDVSDGRDLLVAGTNVLAIQLLNTAASDSNLLLGAELSAAMSVQTTAVRYFVTPTPGAKNGTGTADLGPIVTEVSHPAVQPGENDPIVVTTRVRAATNPVQAGSVKLYYRVMYNSEVAVQMYDDGTHGDGAAGDGVYGATIPASASTAGQMVRWYVTANDTLGKSGRWPVLVPLVGNDGGPEYEGAVIADSALVTKLPVLQWFVVSTTGADDNSTRIGSRASVYWLGEFYDNIFCRRRGLYSTVGHKFEFNSGYDFKYAEGEPRVKEFNLNQKGSDAAYIRPELAFGTYAAVGVPASDCFPVHVERNDAYYIVANMIEQVDNRFLEKRGWYPDGAMYKLTSAPWEGRMTDANTYEKKNRDEESNADLQAFLNGIHQTGDARTKYIYDHVNIPAMVNYLVANILTTNLDNWHKNYYLYSDTNDGASARYGYANADGTGEWTMFPWDMDWTFGSQGGMTDQRDPIAHPFMGSSEEPDTNHSPNLWNWLFDCLYDIPAIKEMFLRRLRTTMDELLQPPGTPYANRNYERQLDDLYAQLSGDSTFMAANPNLASAFNDIKNRYLGYQNETYAGRREHLYRDHAVNTSYADYAGVPAQQGDPLLAFGAYEVNPASGNQDEDYLTLVNPGSVAVDLSGWKLSGGVDYTFKEGVVIPAGGTLYVSPNVWAFRRRSSGPSGNQGLFVQGNCDGHLSAWGEAVVLRDTKDRLVATLTTPSQPSAGQQYLRVTELMYHPQDPPHGSAYDAEDFEYVELKNTSATAALDLTGVRFTDGVAFSFAASAVTSLAPGQCVLVVANQAAFQSRYGAGLNGHIAGTFAKMQPSDLFPSSLDNAGEKITLVDATGEIILSFSYNDSWYTQTDGSGNSLVIRDATAADRGLWDQRDGWAASRQQDGSPGVDEPAPEYECDVIVVGEVLAHRTDEPGGTGDWVEFYNATAGDIPIGGWYLSNDGKELTKYQIAPDTTILAHGYLAFNWRDHFGSTANPGCAMPFTFGELGGSVYLTSGSGGVLSGYQVSEKFGASDTGVSFVRYIKSTGGKDFVASTAPTYESANNPPAVGPVTINEISYHPVVARDPYIELKNTTAAEVKLYDTARPQDRWRLAEGIDFEFPAAAAIPANGYALVVNIDPARFRTLYSIPAGVPIYGPYINGLGNGGDTVELKRPGEPQPDGTVPYYRVDQVTYEDGGAWPKSADGFGASLNRKVAGDYGNEAANWEAGHHTPGRANVAYDATAPSGPTNVRATASGSPVSSVTLNWTAASDAQSGIAHYNIYIGGYLVAVTTGTSYADSRFVNNATYAEIAAVNGDGVEGARVPATSTVHTVSVSAASATAANTVKLTFYEPLSRDAAQDTSHYRITYGTGLQMAVSEAALLPDHKSVQLSLSTNLSSGVTYTATVSGTIAQSGFAMTSGRNTKTFNYTVAPVPPVYVLREYWTGIGGNQLTNFTSNLKFPDNPTGYSDVSGGLQGPANWADSYGTRMRAYITPPTTGNYTFTTHADDQAELWLSTNQDPANAQKIAGTNQTSAAKPLTAGTRYYIEVLHKEDTGNDNTSVGWTRVGGTTEDPIPTSRLTVYVPTPENTVSIAATDANAAETGPDKGNFTITRTGSTAVALTVYYTVTGTASASDVQEDLSGTAILPAGAVSVTIDVTPSADDVQEGIETVKLTLLADKKYTIGGTGNATVSVNDLVAEVRARHVFYNNSAFDGRNASANAADDGAIATDKTPLLPGHEASFDNYTSHSRGLNGIMVDLANTGTGFAASDFEFRVGNSNDLDSWPLLAVAPTVTSRALAGGSTRVTVILPDNAVQNQWLQVKVLATGHTRLASPDVFYFGNAIGETGNHATAPDANAEVDASDEAEVRLHHTATPAAPNNVYDFNRDRRVNATDDLLARANCRSGPEALQLINLAGVGAATVAAQAVMVESLAQTGEAVGGRQEAASSTQCSVPSTESSVFDAPQSASNTEYVVRGTPYAAERPAVDSPVVAVPMVRVPSAAVPVATDSALAVLPLRIPTARAEVASGSVRSTDCCVLRTEYWVPGTRSPSRAAQSHTSAAAMPQALDLIAGHLPLAAGKRAVRRAEARAVDAVLLHHRFADLP